MKLLQIVSNLGLGGAQVLLYDICNELIKRHKVDLKVLTIDSGEYMSKFIEAGIPVIDLAKRGLVNMNIFFDIRRILKEYRPDLVHTHLLKADFYGRLAAKSLGIKSIFSTSHSYSTVHSGADINKINFFDRIDNFVAIHTKCRVIAASNIVQTYLHNRSDYFKNSTQTIYNGIDAETKSSRILSPEQRSKLRSDLGFSDSDKLILVMGRLEKSKGQLTFLQSIRELLLRMNDLKVLILGEGVLRIDIESFLSNNNLTAKVKLAGFKTDTEPYVEISDIVAVPSVWEGFGLVAIEGMIKGKIVIATEVGGLPEIVSDGKNGFLYNADEPHVLIERLSMILSNLNNFSELREAAVLEVKNRFDIKITADKYYKAYEGAMKSDQ